MGVIGLEGFTVYGLNHCINNYIIVC